MSSSGMWNDWTESSSQTSLSLKHWFMELDSGVACSSHWPARWYRIWFFCIWAVLTPFANGIELQWRYLHLGDVTCSFNSSVRFLPNNTIPILDVLTPSCFSPKYSIWSFHFFVNFLPPFHTVLVLTWRALRIQKTVSIFSALVPTAQNRVTLVQVQLSSWSLGLMLAVTTRSVRIMLTNSSHVRVGQTESFQKLRACLNLGSSSNKGKTLKANYRDCKDSFSFPVPVQGFVTECFPFSNK